MDDYLQNWYPVKINKDSQTNTVKWAYLPDRFVEPFFFNTLSKSRSHKFNNLYNVYTDIEIYKSEITLQQNIIPPSAFIFHISRCGSTLIGQMLAALPGSIVISEAEILDDIINFEMNDETKYRFEQLEIFRDAIGYFGRIRFGIENNLYIKLDSWHIMRYDFINTAFPRTPKVFLYRNPLEVILSHTVSRGGQMVPGNLKMDDFIYKPFEWKVYELQKYSVFVLYNFLKAGIEVVKREEGKLMLLNYSQLPAAVWEQFYKFTGIGYNEEQISIMKASAKAHSKNKNVEYKGDSYPDENELGEEILELINRYLVPLYIELEELRKLF